MGAKVDDEFDSGDDLFDDLGEEDLLELSGAKHGRDLQLQDDARGKVKRPRLTFNTVTKGALNEASLVSIAEKILLDKFGYKAFRHEQKDAIARILGGSNALVVFPTGAGKSLCYQIPGIAFEEMDAMTEERDAGSSGITIVVSPLIALMKDQVDALKRKGIAAECMDSTKSWEEIQKINALLHDGQLRLLYCAPERLNNEGFVESMKRVKGGVRLIGVDEAHCISEWGHSFRPDYLKVARFVKEIKAERVICLTATATPAVVDDICKAFDISGEGVFRTSPYRPNLLLEAKVTEKKEDKYDLLFQFLKTYPGSTLQAEALAQELNKNRFPSLYFHAGMPLDKKRQAQDDFMASKTMIVVATIAFGMGIDKSDIRNIVHWDLPSTVEEYCQQIGRAGRDGIKSQCMLYLCPEDFYIKESFARGDLPSRQSLRNLLKDIFDDEVVKLSPGETFKASHHVQCSEFDIRPSPLSIIYATLELRFKLIRATTPEYSSYKFEATPIYFPRLKNDKSPEAQAILKNAVKARKLHSIDLSSVARSTGLHRNALVRVLNELNNTGAIKLSVGGVEQKYKVLKQLPRTAVEIDALTKKIYVDLEKREGQALERIQQVISFITAPKCFAFSIARYFGTNLPDGGDHCGHCTFCLNGKPVKLPPSPPKTLDKTGIHKVLAATDVRDDARFLARVAFGIKSPRVGKLKLDKDPAFMSMAGQDFMLILEEFEKACGKKANAQQGSSHFGLALPCLLPYEYRGSTTTAAPNYMGCTAFDDAMMRRCAATNPSEPELAIQLELQLEGSRVLWAEMQASSRCVLEAELVIQPCKTSSEPTAEMAEPRTLKRLVVFVDGSDAAVDKATEKGHGASKDHEVNNSSIYRLKQVVRVGPCVSSGRPLVQAVSYHTALCSTARFTAKFRSKPVGDNTVELVKSIVKEVCSTLEDPEDELWLYGSGHGAFVARAVAGIVHRLGLPRKHSPFDDLYDTACALIKAGLEDDYRNGPNLMAMIKGHCDDPPKIAFVGLFDTVKLSSPKTPYDISLNSSIKNVRHALALNENRSSKPLEVFERHGKIDMTDRSFIEAWFMGTNQDLCGGKANDGLSLYALQWMLLESIRAGLSLTLTGKDSSTGSPLALVFPQFAGNLPNLDGSEDIEWRLTYGNGTEISMFDLQSTHVAGSKAKSDAHSIKIDSDCFSHSPTRKIFGATGLKGWDSNDPNSTIIHPSVFALLDRYPRYLELPNIKIMKTKIANFQDVCLVDDKNAIAPWLRDMELQASGVKAFRILVCGKTGVGKSTLINKVFGVEITGESQSYDQGVHDINEAFESPRHPGLLIHDSRGWQAGSDEELELIAKFLRNRAFQQDPAKALHVIWFCVDADVSRIEEADKRTFETIAQYSHNVPVFVIGTKKDKLTGYRKMQLLEDLMEKTNDYKEAKRLAEEQANAMAMAQFAELRTQFSQIPHYKADGFCCLSKDDDVGVKDLLSQTLGLIADERVRLFCVAAQVVDVDQKINSAITECMRLGTHAIRTAAVPLPFSGMIGTPTVSRLICEHVLQCFGFPKTAPVEVEKIMTSIVMGNLKNFMAVSVSQFIATTAIAIGVGIPTLGIGVIVGAAGSLWAMPPTARMLLKCSCDMILILERSFRYEGKYVSLKQIEDAAKYYVNSSIKTFSGKDKLLQQQVHDEIDQMIPLKSIKIGFKFNKLRNDVERIIYNNRFGKPPDYDSLKSSSSLAINKTPAELSVGREVSELAGDTVQPTPNPDAVKFLKDESDALRPAVELDSTELVESPDTSVSNTTKSEFGYSIATTLTGATTLSDSSLNSLGKLPELHVQPPELEGDTTPGTPREELEGSTPGRVKSGSSANPRWGRLSSWKLSTRKSKTK
ncbi:hypothetical protein G7046_g3046 [Stylonectria norvegica]|nr:hypothetical protein G7046_g3046 [Stylonectria norvegica]